MILHTHHGAADVGEHGEDKPTATTKHTCGGPVFGRLAPPGECARCDELRAGAEPVRWAWTENHKSAADRDAERGEQMREHFASDRHNNPRNPNYCGRVCTAFDW
jgi:hypothetical protein